MDENVTRGGPDARSFEERVFARFDAMDERMSKLEERVFARFDTLEESASKLDERLSNLEEKVDRRLQETRPIWEAVQAQLKRIDTKLDVVIDDLYEMRTDIKMLDNRVTTLEGGATRP
jgi:chromosome segregation ATPase